MQPPALRGRRPGRREKPGMIGATDLGFCFVTDWSVPSLEAQPGRVGLAMRLGSRVALFGVFFLHRAWSLDVRRVSDEMP